MGAGGGGGGLLPTGVGLTLGSWNVTVPTVGLSSELLFNTSTTTDTGSPGFTWSPTAVSLSSIQKISGTSSLLISTSSRLYTTNYVGYYTPFNGHTFSIWIYPTSLNIASSNNVIISNGGALPGTSPNATAFGIYGVGTSVATMNWRAQYGQRTNSRPITMNNIITLGTGIIALNAWSHIAFTIEPTGYFSVLVNGVQYNNPSPTTSANLSAVNLTTLCIGCATSTTNSAWAGYIDNFRYYRKSSTITDLYNLWCEGYTPPKNYSILANNAISVTSGCMSFTLSNSATVQALIVGGGGGGGGSIAGGGGGGGVIYNTYSLTAGTYNIAVGNGGNGQLSLNDISSSALNGGHSIFGSNVAIGGGAGSGASMWFSQGTTVGNGGSGGGGGQYDTTSGGTGTSGQGYNGGKGSSTAGGGGGGAGAQGSDGTSGGNGGIGITNSITGSSTYYAGGGGGSGSGSVGTGGLGGGGNASNSTNWQDGYLNSGGGGGAGGTVVSGRSAGNGGSGIVIFNIQNGNYYISSNTTNYNIYYVRNSIKFDLTGPRTFYYVAVGPGGAGGGRTDASYFYGGGGGGGIVSGSYTQSGDTTYNITIGSTVLSGTGNSVATSTPTTIVGSTLNVSASAGGSVDSTSSSNQLTGGTAGTSSLGLTGFTGITESGSPSAGGNGSTTAGSGTLVTTGYTLDVDGTTFYMSGGGNGSNVYIENLAADYRFRFDTSFGNITYADDGVSYATCLGTTGTGTITNADCKVGTKSLRLLSANFQYASIFFNGGGYTTPSSGGFSISCWFKADANTSSFLRLFSFSNNGTAASNEITFCPKGGALLYVGSTQYTYVPTLPVDGNTGNNGNAYQNNIWYHFVWTLSYANSGSLTSTWNIYLNNNKNTKTGNAYLSTTFNNTSGGFNCNNIGRATGNNAGYLSCYVDDFRIYNRVLTDAEVAEIYNYTASTYQVGNNTFGGGVGGGKSLGVSTPFAGSVPGGGGGGSANNTRANGGNGGVYLIVPK